MLLQQNFKIKAGIYELKKCNGGISTRKLPQGAATEL